MVGYGFPFNLKVTLCKKLFGKFGNKKTGKWRKSCCSIIGESVSYCNLIESKLETGRHYQIITAVLLILGIL